MSSEEAKRQIIAETERKLKAMGFTAEIQRRGESKYAYLWAPYVDDGKPPISYVATREEIAAKATKAIWSQPDASDELIFAVIMDALREFANSERSAEGDA